MYKNILEELENIKDEKKIEIFKRFFKTGKGEYGEGDQFLGIVVPILRDFSKKYYKEISIEDTIKLLHNKYHEVRLLALFILILKYDKTDEKDKIYNLYLKNTKYINNWDLVDLSAYNIVGKHIYINNIDKKILYDLINTNNLWNQRIAVLSTYYFIKQDDYEDIFKISELLLNHKHDLIHKATGWMLREMGKRNYAVLYKFLDKHYKTMPRTMLRYSIEKIKEEDKKHFMLK
jgi:3-methyladenine DNA glycosylase AlkD